MNLFSFRNPHAVSPPGARESVREDEKFAWLRLSRTENVGPVTFYRLLERFGTAQRALQKLPELAQRGGRKRPLSAPPENLIAKEYAALKKIGGRLVIAAEDSYPLALAAIDDAPPVISVIGNLDLAHKPCIALVGARNASHNGRKFAHTLSAAMGAQGFAVVSGLARGVDTAAHEGSLATGTIAVIAGGIDIIYPEENKKLYERIAAEGLLIAESPLGVQPLPQSFPRRNRIVSGLSKGVIVVEATMRSGSLITARLAGEQGRDVYAVPGHPLDPRAEGPNHLIREGATLVRNADDVLEALRNFSSGFRTSTTSGPRGVSDSADMLSGRVLPFAPPAHNTPDDEIPEDAREALLTALSYEPTGVDQLIRSCGLDAASVQGLLIELELAGRLRRHPGGRVSLTTSHVV